MDALRAYGAFFAARGYGEASVRQLADAIAPLLQAQEDRDLEYRQARLAGRNAERPDPTATQSALRDVVRQIAGEVETEAFSRYAAERPQLAAAHGLSLDLMDAGQDALTHDQESALGAIMGKTSVDRSDLILARQLTPAPGLSTLDQLQLEQAKSVLTREQLPYFESHLRDQRAGRTAFARAQKENP